MRSDEPIDLEPEMDGQGSEVWSRRSPSWDEVNHMLGVAERGGKGMVDVGTVIGDAVETKTGTLVIPVSTVSFGFAAGGTEFGRADARREEAADHPFGGGSGAGVSVRPVGFLVVHQDQVRMLPVDENAALERMVDLAPEILDRVRAMWNDRKAARNGASSGMAETLERAGVVTP
jgi:sporulation protein YtfJ